MRKVSEEWKDGNGFEEEKIDVLMFGDCVFNFIILIAITSHVYMMRLDF
jgi:hypothetical protein